MRLTRRNEDGIAMITEETSTGDFPDNVIKKLYQYENRFNLSSKDRITSMFNDGRIFIRSESGYEALYDVIKRLCFYEDEEEKKVKFTYKDKNGEIKLNGLLNTTGYPEQLAKVLYSYEEKYQVPNTCRLTERDSNGKYVLRHGGYDNVQRAIKQLYQFEYQEDNLPDFTELPLSKMEINKEVLDKVDKLLKGRDLLMKNIDEFLCKPHSLEVSQQAIASITKTHNFAADLITQYDIAMGLRNL